MYHVIKEAKTGEGKQSKMPLADILTRWWLMEAPSPSIANVTLPHLTYPSNEEIGKLSIYFRLFHFVHDTLRTT